MRARADINPKNISSVGEHNAALADALFFQTGGAALTVDPMCPRLGDVGGEGGTALHCTALHKGHKGATGGSAGVGWLLRSYFIQVVQTVSGERT
jgi:hypothetical protein